MFKTWFRGLAAIVPAVLLATMAEAADPPKAADMLFETPHIAPIAAGTELVYKFERKPSDEAVLGKGFTDDVKVKIESDGVPGKKNVLVTMYSGERARDPQRITDMDGNPMLVVYLDGAVAHFSQLAGGDRAYLKNTFSKALGADAKVEPAKISFKGADVDGYKVSVSPYANDRSRAKMRGYEGATFTITLSDKIPGHFAKMVSMFSNSTKGAATLEEVLTLDGVGDIK